MGYRCFRVKNRSNFVLCQPYLRGDNGARGAVIRVYICVIIDDLTTYATPRIN